jgi:hypothetical protein
MILIEERKDIKRNFDIVKKDKTIVKFVAEERWI